LALIPVPLLQWLKVQSTPARYRAELPGARGAGIFAPSRYSRHYAELIRYLNSHAAAGEKLFSGTPRHDQFAVNDVMLYFLAERDPGTYFWCIDAGVTTTREVQLQMRRELTVNRVNWVVLWMDARPEGSSAPPGSPGATTLDEMLATEFAPVERMPSYWVLRRVLGGR
jgi:hypothetical protein